MNPILESKLTPTQRKLVRYILRGKTCVEAASEMRVSARTASVHLWHVYRRLGIKNRMELANLAYAGQRRGGRGDVCPTCKRTLPRQIRSARPLTRRQEEVRRLLRAGRTHREIAVALNLSMHTIKTHVAAIRTISLGTDGRVS